MIRDIAQHFANDLRDENVIDEEDDDSPRPSLSTTAPVAIRSEDKILTWLCDRSSGTDDPPEDARQFMSGDIAHSHLQESDLTRDFAYLPEIWTFVTTSDAYQWLIHRLHMVTTSAFGECDFSEHIHEQVMRTLSVNTLKTPQRDPVTANFKVAWNPVTFLEQQYHATSGAVTLGSVITLTSNAANAHASTCSLYLSRVWPETGEELLQALQSAIEDKQQSRCSSRTFDRIGMG